MHCGEMLRRRRDAQVRNQYKFTVVLLMVGFMVAVQYNTVKKPEERDTRDIWAIRKNLAAEKKLHSELLI